MKPKAVNNKSRSLKKILIGVGAAVAIVMVSLGALLMYANKSVQEAKKVSDQIVNSFQAGDSSAIISLESSNFKQSGSTDSDVQDLVDRLKPYLQGQEKLISKFLEKSNGETNASFVYSVTTSDSTTTYIKVILTKEDGAWRLTKIKTSDTKLDDTIE